MQKKSNDEGDIDYEGLQLNLSDLSINIEKTTECWADRCDREEELEKEPYIWLGNIKFFDESIRKIISIVRALEEFAIYNVSKRHEMQVSTYIETYI